MKDFIVYNAGLRLIDSDVLWIVGRFPKEKADLYLGINGEKAELKQVSDNKYADLLTATNHEDYTFFYFEAPLKEGWESSKNIFIYTKNDGKYILVNDLKKWEDDVLTKFRYNIDSARMTDEKQFLSGWVVSRTPVTISVEGLDFDVRQVHRFDINKIFEDVPEDFVSGFEIRLPRKDGVPFDIIFDDGNEKKSLHMDEKKIDSIMQGLSPFGRLKYDAKRAMEILSKSGVKGLLRSAKKRIHKAPTYADWISINEPNTAELNKQRESEKSFSYRPLFSIVVPVFHTKRRLMDDLLNSVTGQTYSNWELCLADAGAENGSSELTEYLKGLAAKDNRIKYKALDSNDGIAENTNRAIEMSSGDFIAFMDHDDTLALNAFYSIVEELNKNQDIDVFYSDQDILVDKLNDRIDPLMKPDFDIDFLRCCNYISHLFVVKRSLMNKVGLLNKEYDGSQDYDFTFRCIENSDKICHIPKVLYHWRMTPSSTADDPATKKYAYEAGKKAIDAHFKRAGLPATAEITEYYGKYRIHYNWTEQPLLSILIPNKDHTDDLDRCVQSIYGKSTYRNFEFIIVENNSELEETFEYYDRMEKEHDNFHVVKYEGGFNYSKINNFGEKYVNGDYILLLNNDTEIINDDFLWEMLQYAMRSDVGAVGARLYYGDGTIQHAGVVIGYGQVAGHTFWSFPPNSYGMLGRVVSIQDYSACTAACLMTKRSVFEEVGGFNEDFAVAFNDIDFCLKIRDKGYLIVYTPFAEAYHYESRSRGYEDTPEKKERYEREAERLRNNWPKYYEDGDPYYSPNLTLEKADFSLKF